MPLTRIKTTAIDHVFLSEFLGTVASESAMLALVGGIGDYAVRSDLNNDSFIITQNNGSSIGDWQKISNTSTALLKSENLNDLPDAGTARSNLGLGTAATTAATDYATAAQGATADTALQPTNNLNDLNDAGTALDNLGFSTFGKSIIDDADAAAVRTTLGLGEAATSDTLGGSQDFTATGALANGDIVGLRSDGTVEVVTGTSTNYTTLGGTPVNYGVMGYSNSVVFDPNTNKVVISYSDPSINDRGTSIVGTVSGDTITFGTPVVWYGQPSDPVTSTFDSNSNKVVVCYRAYDYNSGNPTYGTNAGWGIVGTVSGNTISFGSPVPFGTANIISATFDSNSNKVVIAYSDNYNNGYGTAVVGTVSGTSISFGTPVVYRSVSTPSVSVTFDSNTNKVVIAYNDNANNNNGTAVVGTVSGTSISFGTSFVVFDNNVGDISTTFDSNTNKVVIAYTSSNQGRAVLGTITGTSITFGTVFVFDTDNVGTLSVTIDSTLNKVVITYRDADNSGYGAAIVGSIKPEIYIDRTIVQEALIDFDTPVAFNSASVNHLSTTFDSNSNKVVIIHSDHASASLPQTSATVLQAAGTIATTNAASWMGIADGTSGTVKILGGVAEGLTGLTPGTSYFVNYDGTLTATENAGPENGTYGKIGRAISSTQLFITEGNA
jgi:hypothetical protein